MFHKPNQNENEHKSRGRNQPRGSRGTEKSTSRSHTRNMYSHDASRETQVDEHRPPRATHAPPQPEVNIEATSHPHPAHGTSTSYIPAQSSRIATPSALWSPRNTPTHFTNPETEDASQWLCGGWAPKDNICSRCGSTVEDRQEFEEFLQVKQIVAPNKLQTRENHSSVFSPPAESGNWIQNLKGYLWWSQDSIPKLENGARVLERNHRRELCSLNEAHERQELELNKRIIVLERTLEEQESRIQKAQAAAQVMTEQTKSFAISDSEVVVWFESMAAEVYDWTRAYACDDLEAFSSIPANEWNSLGKFVVVENGRLPEELLSNTDGAGMLLQGMAMNYICATAFSSPWWVFDALEDFDLALNLGNTEQFSRDNIEPPTEIQNFVHKEVPNVKEHMAKLFNLLQNIQEVSSHQWRVSLMRFFSTNGMGSSKRAENREVAEKLAAGRVGLAKRLTENFLGGPARYLLQHLTEQEGHECFEWLVDQIDRALTKSTHLWTHRSYMKCVGLEGGGLDFLDITSEVAKPHPMHHPGDPTSYDGLPITMLVQPAVVVFGTEEGEAYQTMRRVWMPARVLLGPAGAGADCKGGKEIELSN
ncbi:hypothetical protein VFPPC_13509 [Pochonia chlamydosporia 170]|uniref:Uncharacterized protein n=1 Tax=Pochonia chlamydosporia 170 TaxID=1380566 RepID=A0A179G1W5_METCM|nr:hypothetical protein VFPPC_13509 [Pochonia chlamydosporia 170]OAQ71363.1 hypothetical protein VFPPC_13509 [Pochonia chlamydosporia 170]